MWGVELMILNLLHKVKFWMSTRSEYKLRFNVDLYLCNSTDEMCCGKLCACNAKFIWRVGVGAHHDSYPTFFNQAFARASKIISTWVRLDFIRFGFTWAIRFFSNLLIFSPMPFVADIFGPTANFGLASVTWRLWLYCYRFSWLDVTA